MAIRESLGAIPCLCCGEGIPVKQSEKGAISISCPWCDLSAYAKEGTMAKLKIMSALPKPAAPAAPVAPTKTAPAALVASAAQPEKFKPLFG